MYLLGLAATLVFHVYYFGWYSWFLLVLAVALPWFSLVVSLLAMLRTRLKLETPASVAHGEAAYVTLWAGNGFLPQPNLRFSPEHHRGDDRAKDHSAPKGQKPGELVCAPSHRPRGRLRLPGGRSPGSMTIWGSSACRFSAPAPVTTLVLPHCQGAGEASQSQPIPVRQLKPKPGGGFSEEHELRDYRPGDSPRDIHWKLSVKTDRVIVREAQEPVRGLTLLTFDLQGDEVRIDETLEELLWLSQWLLRHDTPHQILWMDPSDYELETAQVEREEELQALMKRLLQTPLRPDTPSLEGRSFPRATWRCHVHPREETP